MKGMIKKIVPIAFGVFVIVIGASFTASAQRRECVNRNINQRQERQQDRIAQGINGGSLTAAEAARLESQEARINRQEARFRASGDGLSASERAKLESELNRESRNIYRQRHDGQHQ